MTEIPDALRTALSDEVLEASRDAYCNKRDELIDIYGTLTVDALASAQRQALEAQHEFLLAALAQHWPQWQPEDRCSCCAPHEACQSGCRCFQGRDGDV